MNKQEYKEYAMGLNQTDHNDGQLHILTHEQSTIISGMASLINQFETSLYESDKRFVRGETSNLISMIEKCYAKVESLHRLIIKTADINLKNNGLIHGPYAMEQHKYNQNAAFFKDVSQKNLDYAKKINTMCRSRENLRPKTPKTLEEFMFLSSMASQYAWVKPDYRGIEDPYDRLKAKEVYDGFQRKAPKFEAKVVKEKGNSLFTYDTKITDNPELRSTLSRGEKALSSHLRKIARPSHKFAKKVMQASKVFGIYLGEVIDYFKAEYPRDQSKNPITLQKLKELCKEMTIGSKEEV